MRMLDREQAAAALARGETVVLPTDTVYGVGVAVGAVDDPTALFRLKGRPAGKPVAWLVAGTDELDRYGRAVPAWARGLAERFWPGGLTLVVPASDAVPPGFRSAAGTIGLRMPACDAALDLLRAVGAPLAVTSANRSGCPDTGALEHLDTALVDRTAGLYRGEAAGAATVAAPGSAFAAHASAPSSVASTVVDCTGEKPVILRQGALELDVLKGCRS